MSEELVKRLREPLFCMDDSAVSVCDTLLLRDAADEIDHLRAQVAELTRLLDEAERRCPLCDGVHDYGECQANPNDVDIKIRQLELELKAVEHERDEARRATIEAVDGLRKLQGQS